MIYSNAEMNALQFLRQCYCRGVHYEGQLSREWIMHSEEKWHTPHLVMPHRPGSDICSTGPQVDNLILPRDHVKHWLRQPYAAELLHQKIYINVAPKDRQRDRRNKAVSLKNTSRARNLERTEEVWRNPLFLFAAISNPALLTAKTLTTSSLLCWWSRMTRIIQNHKELLQQLQLWFRIKQKINASLHPSNTSTVFV